MREALNQSLWRHLGPISSNGRLSDDMMMSATVEVVELIKGNLTERLICVGDVPTAGVLLVLLVLAVRLGRHGDFYVLAVTRETNV